MNISVGIVAGRRLSVLLNAPFSVDGTIAEGAQEVVADGNEMVWRGKRYKQIDFLPTAEEGSFSIDDVVIGVNFHWERRERQTFRGELHLVMNGDKVQAINRLPLELYLESVISSEMSATSSLELLKAHAVISRSWALLKCAEWGRREAENNSRKADGQMASEDKIIKWYDHDDHTLFDVCADDHCQRYQGITRAANPHVRQAVEATCGEVLMSGGEVCDARFSKCCGGAMEEFQSCWADEPKPYLKSLTDDAANVPIDLSDEAAAERWIRSAPDAFCSTHDKHVLRQVLNDYDQETPDFYRWRVEYGQEQLSELVGRKLGIDFGQIVDLQPVERGRSGRLCLLRIVGTKRTIVVGKELEIRRALSESHLYSSAFVVDKEDVLDGVPQRFVLTGAGWGHGVGLCQIGAAVMGEQGYSYKEILSHYYPGATINRIGI